MNTLPAAVLEVRRGGASDERNGDAESSKMTSRSYLAALVGRLGADCGINFGVLKSYGGILAELVKVEGRHGGT